MRACRAPLASRAFHPTFPLDGIALMPQCFAILMCRPIRPLRWRIVPGVTPDLSTPPRPRSTQPDAATRQRAVRAIGVLAASIVLAVAGAARAAAEGLIVVSVRSGSGAEAAGLAPGDLLLAWQSADGQGLLDSPLQLTAVDMEQAPRGAVTFTGRRRGEAQRWTIARRSLGLVARPDLTAEDLTRIGAGRRAGRTGQSARRGNRGRRRARDLAGRGHAAGAIQTLRTAGEFFAAAGAAESHCRLRRGDRSGTARRLPQRAAGPCPGGAGACKRSDGPTPRHSIAAR